MLKKTKYSLKLICLIKEITIIECNILQMLHQHYFRSNDEIIRIQNQYSRFVWLIHNEESSLPSIITEVDSNI